MDAYRRRGGPAGRDRDGGYFLVAAFLVVALEAAALAVDLAVLVAFFACLVAGAWAALERPAVERDVADFAAVAFAADLAGALVAGAVVARVRVAVVLAWLLAVVERAGTERAAVVLVAAAAGRFTAADERLAVVLVAAATGDFAVLVASAGALPAVAFAAVDLAAVDLAAVDLAAVDLAAADLAVVAFAVDLAGAFEADFVAASLVAFATDLPAAALRRGLIASWRTSPLWREPWSPGPEPWRQST